MRLTLEQLRVFVAVAERQHVTRAAEALHLTQSATSAAIAALESRSGLRLFDRIGRGIALTAAGREFLPEARAVLARAEAAETVLADLAGLGRGTLPVHSSQTIASYWLPRHLVAFRRAHPGIAVPLAIGNTAQVAAAVGAGTAELGFVEGAVEDPLLVARTVATDQLVIVVAPGHPWAQRPPAGVPALAAGEWVLREPGSGTRSAFEEALRIAGLDPQALRIALELPSNESVRGAVEAGLGATALSASVAAPSIEAGLLQRVSLDLPGPTFQRAFQVLRHRDRAPSRAAEALLALLPGG
ncbi:LysR family transcriptional regulator [Pararoseomonas indoligenes]|uniref:LysR family transcriptional regulator n=1 Tax=Roseomonas indoligenes TaxID=2820811 RepID=A0A940N3V9_9PROT|nr:LysR family transcriptional regulator [Pararoseomonas indoligenes]MBP0496119.1 LysR family transcriptional regulator [Pararoseomonas indoligenes]